MPAITLALAAVGDALAAVVAPEPHLFQPVDLVQLVTAIFSGVALLLTTGIGAFVMITNARSKRNEETLAKVTNSVVEVKETVVDLKKNTDGLASRTAAMARKLGVQEGTSAGIAAGIATAATLAEGQRQGREQSAALSGGEAPVVGAPPSGLVDKQGNPISVEDDRTAKASERVASATERVAVSTEKRTVLADQEKKP